MRLEVVAVVMGFRPCGPTMHPSQRIYCGWQLFPNINGTHYRHVCAFPIHAPPGPCRYHGSRTLRNALITSHQTVLPTLQRAFVLFYALPRTQAHSRIFLAEAVKYFAELGDRFGGARGATMTERIETGHVNPCHIWRSLGALE